MTEAIPKAVRVDIAIKTACEWIETVEIIDPENVPTDAALALVMHLVSALREARKDEEPMKEMTDGELVARQARRIAELEVRIGELEKQRDAVHPVLYGVGAPLNDNVAGFSRTQLRRFELIAEALNLE